MSRLLSSHDVAQILPLSEVPPHDSNYAFAGAFLESEKLKEKIDVQLAELARIENLSISNAEKIARLKIGYDLFQKKIAAHVQSFLLDPPLWHNGVGDPFTNFEIRFWPRDKDFYVPPFSMFEEAIKLQRDDGISDHDRAKQLANINVKIDELRKKMPTISSEDRLFVEFWRDIQSQLSEPSGPRALSLDASDNLEKNAWKTLGLENFINPRGLRPNSAD